LPRSVNGGGIPVACVAQRGTFRYDLMNYGGGRGAVAEPTVAPPAGANLARRLKDLRRSGFPGTRLTQLQLATALSQDESVADSTLSSWENDRSPTLPPPSRLSAYAQFFATRRSLQGGKPHLVPLEELTPAEHRVREDLEQELLRLRDSGPETASDRQFWRFDDGARITVICSDLRKSDELVLGPLAEEDNPNYAELYSYGDLDALFDLHGHLRATNPSSPVHLARGATPNLPDHLVVLGGIAWNDVTRRLNDLLPLPVRQEEDGKIPTGEIFVTNQGEHFVPRWRGDNPGRPGEPGVLLEDVGMLARVPNPYNELRTLTYCNGIHSRGVLGAVRCLTDPAVRDDNEEYLQARFSGSDSFVILMRVPVLGGQTVSPSLKSRDTVLFQWPGDPPEN
jgi:transcriptional regulator with XRE-family HTH domain